MRSLSVQRDLCLGREAKLCGDGSPSALVCAITSAACSASALVAGGVLRRELVTALAVGLLGGTSCARSGRFASPDVFGVRDRLHVRRVHARSHTAEMVEFKPGRDRSDKQFVDMPMRQAGTVERPNAPVALGLLSCRPHPARSEVGPMGWHWAVLVDLRPQIRPTAVGELLD